MARNEREQIMQAQREARLELEKNFLKAAAESKDLTGFLMVRSLNVNAQDGDGRTALMLLAIRYRQAQEEERGIFVC